MDQWFSLLKYVAVGGRSKFGKRRGVSGGTGTAFSPAWQSILLPPILWVLFQFLFWSSCLGHLSEGAGIPNHTIITTFQGGSSAPFSPPLYPSALSQQLMARFLNLGHVPWGTFARHSWLSSYNTISTSLWSTHRWGYHLIPIHTTFKNLIPTKVYDSNLFSTTILPSSSARFIQWRFSFIIEILGSASLYFCYRSLFQIEITLSTFVLLWVKI